MAEEIELQQGIVMQYECEMTEFRDPGGFFDKIPALPMLEEAISLFGADDRRKPLELLYAHLKTNNLNTVYIHRVNPMRYLPTGGGGYYMW